MMKNIVVISIASVLLFAFSQTCGCGNCKAQTLQPKAEVKKENKKTTVNNSGSAQMKLSQNKNHIKL